MRQRPAELLVGAILGLAVGGCTDASAPGRSDTYAFAEPQSGLIFHWPAERLPVRVWVHADAGIVRDFVARGIEIWNRQFLYGEFRGRIVEDSAAADVVVRVVPATPPSGMPGDDDPALAACGGVTINDVTPDGQLAGPFRIAIDWDVRFPDQDVVNCLERVTFHELGHAIGLLAHSPDETDLMNAAPRVRTPSPVDRATVEVLYHTPPTLRPPQLPEGS